MKYLRESTASQEVVAGPFVDATDGVTPETALTPANTDIRIQKAGSLTFVNKNSGGGTHQEDGYFSMTFDATDSNTLGSGVVQITMAGALPVAFEICVLPTAVYDAMILGTGNGVRADVQIFPLSAAPTAKPVLGTDTIDDVINWLGAYVGRLHTVKQTATTTTVRNAADGADIASSTTTDSSGTLSLGEFV